MLFALICFLLAVFAAMLFDKIGKVLGVSTWAVIGTMMILGVVLIVVSLPG